MPLATPLSAAPEQLAAIRYNADGLVPAIIQEHASRTVLMMGWMNEAVLLESLESGRTVFWSRSRAERWRKGDTSGDRQWIREAYYDCDGDTLLFLVEQEGRGACHTGEFSCFHNTLGAPLERTLGAPLERTLGAPLERTLGAPLERSPGAPSEPGTAAPADRR